MRNKIALTIVITTLISIVLIKNINATEMYFDHETGAWIEPGKQTYTECLKDNISKAHTDRAVFIIEAICKAETD